MRDLPCQGTAAQGKWISWRDDEQLGGLAIGEFAKQEEAFMVSISEVTGSRRQGHRYIFRGCPSGILNASQEGSMLHHAFQELLRHREDYEYGYSIAENFWRGLTMNKKDVAKVGESWCKLVRRTTRPIHGPHSKELTRRSRVWRSV